MKTGGRVAIPREVLKAAGLAAGDELTVEVRDGAIVLRRASRFSADGGYGMGSYVWRRLDTDAYMRRDRSSWDRGSR